MGPSAGTCRRQQAATAAHMAILCVLNNDDSREGQPDDIALCSDTVEIGFFGSKIYPPLLGQIIRMPRLTRRGLPRTGLRAPDPSSRSSAPGSPALVWPERLSSALLPRRQLGILGHWPQEVRDLAIPLYKRSLLLHSVPSLKWLLAVPILEGTDLSAPLSNRQSRFRHLAKRLLAEAYAATTGAGAHRFQRGGIAELSHGGLDLLTLSTALHRVSERFAVPYVFQAAHSSAIAVVMHAAVHRSRVRGRICPVPGQV